ncbi:MAG: hypothetical protein AB7H77_07495 [Bdellovibrionales bacterium]
MSSPFLTRVTAPAATPITAAELKAHSRIVTASAEDTYLNQIIAAATATLDGREGWLGRALITQEWQLTLDSFPSGSCGLTIPLPPLQEIVSISYVDENGDEQTLDDSAFTVVAAEPAYLIPAEGTSWPSTQATTGAVTVQFICGYGDAATDIPALIKQYLFLTCGDFYENREFEVVGTITAEHTRFIQMLESYRIRNAIYARR